MFFVIEYSRGSLLPNFRAEYKEHYFQNLHEFASSSSSTVFSLCCLPAGCLNATLKFLFECISSHSMRSDSVHCDDER